MLTIPGWLQVWLKTKPEYGMGYQKGIAKLSNRSSERGFILNGATFAKEDEFRSLSASDLTKVSAVIHESSLSIKDIDLIARPPETLRGVRHIALVAKAAQFNAINESIQAS